MQFCLQTKFFNSLPQPMDLFHLHVGKDGSTTEEGTHGNHGSRGRSSIILLGLTGLGGGAGGASKALAELGDVVPEAGGSLASGSGGNGAEAAQLGASNAGQGRNDAGGATALEDLVNGAVDLLALGLALIDVGLDVVNERGDLASSTINEGGDVSENTGGGLGGGSSLMK